MIPKETIDEINKLYPRLHKLTDQYIAKKIGNDNIRELGRNVKQFYDKHPSIQLTKVKTRRATWEDLYPFFWERVKAKTALIIFKLPSRLRRLRWYLAYFGYIIKIETHDLAGEASIASCKVVVFELKHPDQIVILDISIVPEKCVEFIELRYTVKPDGGIVFN